MDANIVRQAIIDRMRRHSESLDEAAATIRKGFDLSVSDVEPTLESIRREGRRNQVLDTPPGVFDEDLTNEARQSGWYSGPEDGDEVWPRLKRKLESGSMRDVVDDIDTASTKVVAHLADPHIRNLKKRGMVVGYVQSGKTANYTAVMAKSADAGYRLFIVLSGLHNNLRKQTQVRVGKDLVDEDWLPLTSDDGDFGDRVAPGSAVMGNRVKAVAVVKKNQARLTSLRQWLRDIPLEIRRRTPILLLDDEADQATPNSASEVQQRTRINTLVREIWAEIPTGTYVGYTATPFANVFMDPADEEELYPADFIIDLPRPANYFGAERVFGREPIDDADEPDPGIDMVRTITDDEAASLKPPSGKDGRESFDPELPNSLVDAVRWYLIASAIRRARGQVEHSSMLVHTTHYTQPHFAMKDRLESLLDHFAEELSDSENREFLAAFEREAYRAADVATRPMPAWAEIDPFLDEILEEVRVVVDNGFSEDRLDYRDDKPETVIAVGGGTLSRGLTLEGLIVSYFTRTSNTYDTLLQMGRWFGYRVGYEDLPRIWVQESLAQEFRFLALVEEEIRLDMRDMERQRKTPRELGVRIRAHPGRLAIVARNKMRHAQIVSISYSGERLQTFIFDELDRAIIQHNQEVAREFVGRCAAVCPWTQVKDTSGRPLPRWISKNVTSEIVSSLLDSYSFHEDQIGMRSDHMIGWIRREARESFWNIVVVGTAKAYKDADGKSIDLGSLDLGLPLAVRAVNRAPLVQPPRGTANIKALLSHHDWFADLDREVVSRLSDEQLADPKSVRRTVGGGVGQVIIYVVSKDSIPMGASVKVQQNGEPSRRRMEAPDHLIGIGIVFPNTDDKNLAGGGTYYSVHPDWEVEAPSDVDDDEIPEDNEGDAVSRIAGRDVKG